MKTKVSNITKTTVYVSPDDVDNLQVLINSVIAGTDVSLCSGVYAADLIVPTGINLIGTGTNCILQGNLTLLGTANAKGLVITDGYYVEQNGAKYYA